MLKEFSQDTLGAIYAIYSYYVLNSTATFDIVVPEREAFYQRMRSIAAKYPFFIYEEEGKVKGYAYASDFRTKDAYAQTVELTIYLNPEEQHKGIGSKLMQALIEELKKRKFVTAVSVVTQPNEASEYLHEKFGFTPVGTLPSVGYKFDQYLNVSFYYLDLKEK
ncbi:MAG: GNAT family N-acetyltransferase [Bacteroidales bacterium]